MIATAVHPPIATRAAVDILHVIPYMHPNAGGPPVVVDRLCEQLQGHGWRNRVVCTDAFADADDIAWRNRHGDKYPLEIYPARGPGSYSYSRPLSVALCDLVAKSRLVHLHTAWTHPTWSAMRACRRYSVPYIVMPHGMLDPNSLSRKWLKKQVYGRLVEWPNLRSARAMIYTTVEEQKLAERSVPGLPGGYVVPLAADEPPGVPRESLAREFLDEYPSLRGQALIMYLSRLHPKKGLDLLIPAFAILARQFPKAQLVLVGPGHQEYVEHLKKLADQQRVAQRVHFLGPLDGRAKWAALAAAHVFVLPSYQENFAIVVAEALRMGVPVVLSKRVNIWEEVVASGGAMSCELTTASIASAVQPWVENSGAATAAGQKGQEYARRQFTWDRSANAMSEVYTTILNIEPSNHASVNS